jgi:hypothetical protein
MAMRCRENQNRITELVGAVVRRFQRGVGASEHVVALKRAQHLVVALVGRVRPGKHRIDDAQTRARADALIGDAFAGTAAGMY